MLVAGIIKLAVLIMYISHIRYACLDLCFALESALLPIYSDFLPLVCLP